MNATTLLGYSFYLQQTSLKKKKNASKCCTITFSIKMDLEIPGFFFPKIVQEIFMANRISGGGALSVSLV